MKVPTILWGQSENYIYIDIQLVPSNYEIKITEESVFFKQDEYECNLKLFNKIDEEKSRYNKNRIFEIILKKKDENEWKQLLEKKNQYNIKVNWDKCDISDDEIEESGMPDMSSLMGGGGMPDMSSLMGEGGMPDMSEEFENSSENLCPRCPDQNYEDYYEDDFEIDSNDSVESENEVDSNDSVESENEDKEDENKEDEN